MDDCGKNYILSITASMLMIVEPIFTFDDAPPEFHNF